MNCEPGDMAYLVLPSESENSYQGAILKVDSFRSDDPRFGRIWNVRSGAPVMIWCADTGACLGLKTYFQCPDDFLRRISGLKVDCSVEDEVTA
ncbi:hypothetical protein [Burkholderia anthina]|uniref:hypothetical protein n=1 Tax=Burkholderia anthina TaxID=179879 RepID=UPI00158B20AC|nr:hypothetical protein [Burkholderia anthina]